MIKLFRLKQWLTIEDACKRLSVVFGEEVSSKDLIQLVIEEQINISYYFKLDEYTQAVEVIKDNVYLLDSHEGKEFLSTNEPLSYITRAKNLVPYGEAFRVFVDDEIEYKDCGMFLDYRAIGTKFYLDGAYNIDINTGNIKSILENMFFETKSDFEPEYFNGVIVKGEDGDLYKLISGFDDVFMDGQPIWSLPPYSLELEPKISDLVILRTDLEKFEQSFLEVDLQTDQSSEIDSNIHLDEKITNTDTWTRLYTITEKAVKAYPEWEKKQPNPRVISKDRLKDWLLTNFKITTREADFMKKVLQEIFKF